MGLKFDYFNASYVLPNFFPKCECQVVLAAESKGLKHHYH